MGNKTKTHVCFTVGAVVPWEKAILFGNILAEPPIVIDYLKKTRGIFLPTGPGEPERDWWDEGPLTERAKNYRAILAARKHGLTAGQLDELSRGKIPDLLTFRGLKAAELAIGLSGRGSRHEFYEIKPRSLSGIEKGTTKVTWLRKAYAAKGLPYLPGLLYPTHFYPPDGVVELPLLMIDTRHITDWNRRLKIISKRAGMNKVELSLEVRPAPSVAGLLLYRICVTIEYDDDKNLTDAKVIHNARDLVNSFVMSAVAGKPKEIAWEVGAVARAMEPALLERPGRRLDEFAFWKPEPVLLPMVDVELVSGPQMLRPRLPAVRDALNTRYMGLPGDRLMLCCDEAFWQAVIAPQSTLQLIHYLRQTPARWGEYARDRSGLGVLDAVQEATEVYDAASAARMATFNPLVDWTRKNPGEAVLIGVGVIVVSALAFWALPALATELAALEAASLAASSGAISGTFIETAAMSTAIMEQATALELATAAQLNLDAAILGAANAASVAAVEAEATAIATATALPVSATLAGVATTAEAALLRQTASVIGRRLVLETLKRAAPKIVGGGIGVTLMVASQTAFAAKPGARIPGGPVPSQEAFDQVIGSMASRLFAFRPEVPPKTPFPGGSPVKRTPTMGERIDAAKFSPDAAEQAAARGEKEYSCHYLGELLVK
jgi:hypothetical protein